MEVDTSRSSENLLRPDWNSLEANYELHDIGEDYFTGLMRKLGLVVENWGLDAREEDENLIYDNKMDLRLWDPLLDGETPGVWPTEEVVHHYEEEDAMGVTIDWKLRGVCDIKTKSSESWMGIFNLRHLAHYAHWSAEYDVPVFLYFSLVDTEKQSVGETTDVVPIEPWDGYEHYVDHYNRNSSYQIDTTDIVDDCPYVERTFGADDGNPVVVIDDDHCEGFEWIVENVV